MAAFGGALARLLRAAGFNPVGYSSAESFLADPMRAQTDCLVLDVHLGGMSGLDLQERLTARPIALSGSVSPSASSPSRPMAGPSAWIPVCRSAARSGSSCRRESPASNATAERCAGGWITAGVLMLGWLAR